MRPTTFLATMTLATLLGGCWPARKKKPVLLPFPPPPPAAAKPAPKPAATLPVPPSVPIGPAPQPLPPPVLPDQPAPAKKTPRPRRKIVAPVLPKADPPPAPAPQLSELLSDERRRQYDAEFSKNVAQARGVLNQLTGRNLNVANRKTADRVRTFLDQAEAEKVRDLVTALQLAKRADLLAQDLLDSLR
jgi:hypothetical protein